MPVAHTPWSPGTPCWVDLMTRHQQAALDFYRPLFGWSGDPGEGGYAVLERNGGAVAGIGSAQAEEGRPEPPHVWTTYLASDDARGTARRITGAGGTVVVEPREIGTVGTMLLAADPTGAVFGVWQGGDFPGAGVVNEPGAVIWNDCATRDVATAAEFYEAVFGLEARPVPDGGGFGLHPAGAERPVGGLRDMAASDYPENVPPHWLTCFAVSDTPATVEAASRTGGPVLAPPTPTPYGVLAVLSDPWGATFAVMQVAEE
ncbi:VOC family protein [Streptomyces sp. NPDC058045]|uniref:VOC family protein n=1 Tax=Streptomyces sp. NPDC058045 TaxID=3346311 RepID=UPI0036E32675